MEKRRDNRNRNLKDGESQRPDGSYRYRYTDRQGKRHEVTSWKLVPTDKTPAGKRDGLSLREMESQINQDLTDGIDSAAASALTVNDMFDKYISLKKGLKEHTRVNYKYTYDHFIRNTFGIRKIKDVRYSDVKAFYSGLIEQGFKPNTLDNIHCLIHPTFTLAVRDGVIRSNITDGVLADLMKDHSAKKTKRHALTVPEQSLLMEFIHQDPIYHHWEPLFTFFLGTGCRVGEVIGITWKDIDFQNGTISINHNTIYRSDGNHGMVLEITTPKTDAGVRVVPLLPEVRSALIQIRQDNLAAGIRCHQVIDGYTDFVFMNRFGNILLSMDINRAIDRIIKAANVWEQTRAEKEGRAPAVINHFSVHNLRHTFCTRLCEVENNIKLIMSIMGHSDVQTTMDIYNEIQEQKRQTAFTDLGEKMKISC